MVSYYLLVLSYHSLIKKATKSTQYVRERSQIVARFPFLLGQVYLGGVFSLLGRLGAVFFALGRSWGGLGSSWVALGVLLAFLGRSWGGLGTVFGRLGPS